MNIKLFVLPSLCLGGAAMLLAPAEPASGFSKIGGSLGESQRDFRIFNNFLDSTANNNAALDTQFPGRIGAALAVWKGAVEWGSLPHGDGTGDPINGNVLGGAGANFDPMWAGNTNGIGTSNNNIVSSLTNCGGGGTLAFTETPIGDGWRIRFCDEWTWDDGPGTINFRWDIQGVMTHEYGHALGLGHSGSNSATMAPSGSAGSTIERSIETDDINGIRCIYGVASGTKPVITATVADMGANTITIHGSNFAATGNEVWFTNGGTTGTGGNPIIAATGVNSSNGGTQISISIPAGAGKGDVIVNTPGSGHSTMSNAFPTDLEGTFGDPPGGCGTTASNATRSGGLNLNVYSATPAVMGGAAMVTINPGTAHTFAVVKAFSSPQNALLPSGYVRLFNPNSAFYFKVNLALPAFNVPFNIPNDPIFCGLTAYSQAILTGGGAGLAWTNSVDMTAGN